MARGDMQPPRRCNFNLKERWKVGKWHGPVLPGQASGRAMAASALDPKRCVAAPRLGF